MESMLTDDFEHCFRCKYGRPSEIHHVINGTANRSNSDAYKLVIPLCRHCHDLIHKNQKEDLKFKRIAQKKFEHKYGHEKFMKVFKKNYL